MESLGIARLEGSMILGSISNLLFKFSVFSTYRLKLFSFYTIVFYCLLLLRDINLDRLKKKKIFKKTFRIEKRKQLIFKLSKKEKHRRKLNKQTFIASINRANLTYLHNRKPYLQRKYKNRACCAREIKVTIKDTYISLRINTYTSSKRAFTWSQYSNITICVISIKLLETYLHINAQGILTSIRYEYLSFNTRTMYVGFNILRLLNIMAY